MKLFRLFMVLSISAVIGSFSTCGGNGSDGENGMVDGYYQASSGGITLRWRVSGDSLDVIVSADTTGWVAVGFDPTSRMQDANIIIGYVEGPMISIRDDFGTSISSHSSDESLGGTGDVTNVSGSEAAGITEISFTIPLDSGDQYDRPLAEGSSYKVLLAYGPDGSDDFTTYHVSGRSEVTIDM